MSWLWLVERNQSLAFTHHAPVQFSSDSLGCLLWISSSGGRDGDLPARGDLSFSHLVGAAKKGRVVCDLCNAPGDRDHDGNGAVRRDHDYSQPGCFLAI